jgi:Flp pilus assembly protein TadG
MLMRYGISQRGTVLIEFIIVGTAVIVLLIGGLEFGRGLNAFIALENGARETARYRAVRGSPGDTTLDAEARCWAVRSMPGYASSQPDPCDPTVPVADGGRCVLTTNGDPVAVDGEEIQMDSSGTTPGGVPMVTVTIRYNHGLFFVPVPGVAPASDCLGRPSFPMMVSVSMRIE